MNQSPRSANWRSPKPKEIKPHASPLAEQCAYNEALRISGLPVEKVLEIRKYKGKAKNECRKYGITSGYFNAIRRKDRRKDIC